MGKIIFRADGNSVIGLGHFFRVLALADLVKEEFECFCAMKTPDEFVKNQIRKTGIGLIELGSLDYEKLTESIGEVPFDLGQHLTGNEIVVLDGYWFSDSYQKKIKQFGCSLVFIDDVYKEYPYADVIVNHALDVSLSSYKNTTAKILGGPDYSLMRKEFLQQAKQGIAEKIKFDTAFVCFGGADTNELAFKMSSFLANSYTAVRTINILNSSSYRGESGKFEDLAKTSGKDVIVHKNLSAAEIINVMTSSDFAIISASNIAYECVCTGLPMVVGYYVDHQIRFYSALGEQSNVEGIGEWQSATASTLRSAVDKLIKKYDPNAGSLIDGFQQERFLQMFRSIKPNKAIL
jgi:UDP-2,4-diacetamido-2,4,6-trideoxy-beta-L-altropyranose hydrolase